jgi:hypothetical protein
LPIEAGANAVTSSSIGSFFSVEHFWVKCE